MKSSEEKSWFRLENESARQYEIFVFYLNLKPSECSYQEVSKRLGISRKYIERIAARFDWQSRARDYSNHFAARADEVKNEAVKELAMEWAEWEMSNLEQVREITENILFRCEEMLNLPLEESTEKTKPAVDSVTGKIIKDSQGNIVYQNITITKPTRFNASDAPKYAEAAIILTKFLTEYHQPKPAPFASFSPAPDKPVEEMSIKEREQYIEQIRDRQRRIINGVSVIDFENEKEN